MSSFDARKDSPALRRATAAFVGVMLDELLPDLRLAAKGCGYAIAVHGSQARDVDLVAIPWEAGAQPAEDLLECVLGVCRAKFGRACTIGKGSDKPHGRRAFTIMPAGASTPEIDLSIMPLQEEENK